MRETTTPAAEELHVATAQRDELALAQAGIGGDADQLGVLGGLVRSASWSRIRASMLVRVGLGQATVVDPSRTT